MAVYSLSESNREAIIEVVKSFLRFLWFGFLGLVVTFLTNLVASGDLNEIMIEVAGASLPLGTAILMAVTGLIKLIDRYIHKNKNINAQGLAPSVLQR